MRFGIIVEGDSEFNALPPLLDRLRSDCGITSIKIMKANIAPEAPIETVAAQFADRVMQQVRRGAERLILLLDREQQEACCGELSRRIAEAVERRTDIPVTVVIKNRCFENWVIADLDAISAQPARFLLTRGVRNKVEPNKADGADALALLNRISRGPAYSKVRDSRRTLQLADPLRLANNSRSFRRFLRTLGHPLYHDQSRAAKP